MRSIYQVVGENILYLRRLRKMTQEDLSWKAEIEHVGSIERGHCNITLLTLSVLAEALEAEPYELLLSPERLQKKYSASSPELQYTGE